jgi:hypothetical protein
MQFRRLAAGLALALALGMGVALGQDNTTTTTSSTSTTTYTLPPEQVACGTHYHCMLRACRKACDTNAYCRARCFERWDACLHANGCDFAFPFCITGVGYGECNVTVPGETYGCAVVRLVNRTADVLSNVAINGQATGVTVPPHSAMQVLIPPSLSGVTVTADSMTSVDASGGPCAWTFTRARCLDEVEKQRVTFRRGNSSCAQ